MRYSFGGGDPAGLVVQNPVGNSGFVKSAASATGTVWDSETGGTQLTDLLVGGLAATTVSSSTSGFVNRFQGPDNVTEVWVDFNVGQRFQMRAVDPLYFKRSVGLGTYTQGDVLKLGAFAYLTRLDVGTSVVMGGGSSGQENVVGGNLANVDTATSNLTGAPTLTNENGNWNFLLGGYDTVVNGWANSIVGFHCKVGLDANHNTIGGGSRNAVNASSTYGTIGGGTGNTVGGASATVGGGTTNAATGNNSAIGGGNNNTTTGSAATVGGGSTNTASADQATIGGGNSNAATALQAIVSGGLSNTATGIGSTVPGGRTNYAAGDYSTARGRGAVAYQYGEDALAMLSFAAAGDAQSSVMSLFRQTTDATASDLRLNNTAPATCPENTTWMIRAMVVARRTDVAGENAAWSVTGTYKRDVGNTGAWVGTPTVTSVGANAGNVWTLTTGSFSVGNVRLICTGEAAKTIRWVCRFEVAQVQQPAGAAWAATTAYNLGQRVTNGAATLLCITAGTTAGSAPTNPTVGLTVADGTAVWLQTV